MENGISPSYIIGTPQHVMASILLQNDIINQVNPPRSYDDKNPQDAEKLLKDFMDLVTHWQEKNHPVDPLVEAGNLLAEENNERLTVTFIAALRYDRIEAPWVIDGAINANLFTAYVVQVLAPTLSKGDVVILDNLNSRKAKAARATIRAKGAHLIFLPPYSPDLNPIEQVFAKLKHLMREAQQRTVENIWQKVGKLLHLFS